MSLLGDPLSMTIRPMREDDLEIVHALDILVFPSPWTLANYRHELQSDISDCWVAVDNETIIGMVVAWLLVDEIHIATIAVAQTHRRKGVGKQLLCIAFAKLAQEGAITATLEVRAGNDKAQALYQHFGFEVVGERLKYYRNNKEDALIMTVSPLTKALTLCGE